jgi:hypothetical protein
MQLWALLCSIIGHRRSARRAYFDPRLDVWRSYCRRCGKPMVRTAPGHWRHRARFTVSRGK